MNGQQYITPELVDDTTIQNRKNITRMRLVAGITGFLCAGNAVSFVNEILQEDPNQPLMTLNAASVAITAASSIYNIKKLTVLNK